MKADRITDSLTKVIVTFFGAGYSPIMPGTVGTLFAIPLYYLLTLLGPVPYVIITIALIAIAIPAASRAEEIFDKKDASQIVIDEVVGYLTTMLFFWKFNWVAALVGFVAFRFFDILKIPPSNLVEQLKRGAGVVLDDVAAGVYACLATHLIVSLIMFLARGA